MTVRRLLTMLLGLTVLSEVLIACGSATPAGQVSNPAFEPSLTAPPDTLTPLLAPQNQQAGQFLFIEIWEERVQKTGAQTTSFAGEPSTYSFNPQTGRLRGPMDGTLVGEMPLVVGYVTVARIDQNSLASGRLYAVPETGGTFGPVAIEGWEPDGAVRFTFAGQTYRLRAGESIRLEVEAEPSGEGLPAGALQHIVTVSHHGFIPLEALSIETS